MTLITDIAERVSGSIDGTEEYLVNVGTTDYKVLGSSITAAVVATHSAYVTSNDAAVLVLTNGKLNLAGGTMTGDIVLNGAPTAGLHPTTKTYVDNALALKAAATGATLDATATGVTASDTTESTALATTLYTANKIKYEVLKKTTINTATHTLTEAEKGRILVTRTGTGTCVFTLPIISGYTDSDRVEYYIVDTGNGAETYNITVNTNAADAFTDGTTTKTITSDGGVLHIASTGATEWTVLNSVATATTSTTVAGATRYSTNAEALALTHATSNITPSELGNVLDQEIYNSTVISGASKTFVEGDSGKWYVTRTATGTCALTLPDPSALTSANRFVIEIWDVETAGTNAITINTTAGNIDGASTATINVDKAGMVLINDGTNYFTIANTQRASGTASGTANLLAKFDSTGVAITDSLILDDGDQLGVNGAVHAQAMANVSNSGFTRSLRVVQTGTNATQYAAEFLNSGVNGGSNYGIGGSAVGGDYNAAFYAGDNITTGYTYKAFQANMQGSGPATSSAGFDIGSTVTGAAVYGGVLSLTGAATSNTGIKITSSGASTNYSLDLVSGDVNLGTNAIDLILDTTTGTKIGTATSQKLGVWNATPIVQPTTAYTAATFAANTSGIADDTATWDSYTIGAIVGALRGVGILA
jgi:hypothetical protein